MVVRMVDLFRNLGLISRNKLIVVCI